MKGLESAEPAVEELEYCRDRDSLAMTRAQWSMGGTRSVQGNP